MDTVAKLVLEYLTEEYRPHEIFQDEEGRHAVGEDFQDHTGFHVCGFTKDGKPKCHNIFWGTDIPPQTPTQPPEYRSYPMPYAEQPLNSRIEFVYTGRNDLADRIIRTFLDEIRRGLETRYDLGTTVGMVQLADLVMRFSAEITPRVGPPFHIAIIDPNNHIQEVINLGFSPINPVQVNS